MPSPLVDFEISSEVFDLSSDFALLWAAIIKSSNITLSSLMKNPERVKISSDTLLLFFKTIKDAVLSWYDLTLETSNENEFAIILHKIAKINFKTL